MAKIFTPSSEASVQHKCGADTNKTPCRAHSTNDLKAALSAKSNHMNDMNHKKIAVINYLDMHAFVNNRQIEDCRGKELCNAFPEIDEFTLNSWKKEWKKARQAMLDLKF